MEGTRVYISFVIVRLRNISTEKSNQINTPYNQSNAPPQNAYKDIQSSNISYPPPDRSILPNNTSQIPRTRPAHPRPQRRPRPRPPPWAIAHPTRPSAKMYLPVIWIGFPKDSSSEFLVTETVGVGFGVGFTFDFDIAVGCAIVGCVVLLK